MLLQNTDLIIWDEVPMQRKYCFEAINHTLNDICYSEGNSYFGNIPVLLGGDFAQILLVVKRGNRAQVVAAYIQRSVIWNNLQILNLQINMRVRSDVENTCFAI